MAKGNVVSRQTVKFSLVNYSGAAIGIISTLFIYPLDKEFLGIIRYVQYGAEILMPLLLFGSSTALINFFPSLRDSKLKLSQFFTAILLTVIVNGFLLGAVVWLLFTLFSSYFENLKMLDYLEYSLIIGVFLAFIDVFKKLSANYQRIAVPTFLERLLPKLFLPTIFIILISGSITDSVGVWFFVISYFLIFLVLGAYAFSISDITLSLPTKKLFDSKFTKKVVNYSAFSFFGTFGALLAFKIDGLMIPNLISMEANGSYSIGAMLAATVAIPAAGVFAIYSPIISDLLKKNEIEKLGEKYRLTSKILLMVGGVLFSCIFLGVQDLFDLLPTKNELLDSIPIIMILGLNVVLDMSTGFNSHIIMYSKYYRFNIITLLILIIFNIVLNYVLIANLNMGIKGAAIATLISMTLYNLVKLVFIYKKFGLLPFDKTHLKLFALIVGVAGFLWIVPLTGIAFFDLIIKVVLCLGINLYVIYRNKYITVFNEWMDRNILPEKKSN